MATASRIRLTPETLGVYRFRDQDQKTADRTSELLQENHEKHHVFFNNDGFHNHIAHHVLSLYGLGAPLDAIERQYSRNASYQLPQAKPKDENVEALSKGSFSQFLGKGPRYSDFLSFYQREIDAKGWEAVIKEYLFSGEEKAEDLLVRMFAGFLHPIIHLGFGVEFKQPAIIAEALAQASVHDVWMGDFLRPAEAASKKNGNVEKTLVELLEEMQNDDKIRSSAHWDDANKLRDGVLVRAPEEMIALASQWIATPETLEAKTAEMQNAAVYFASCAQRPPKEVKFDFFYMHCVNASIFWNSFNALDFLSAEQKCRLLEWKARSDLGLYASRGSPTLLLEEVSTYFPKHLEAGQAEWPGLFKRMFAKDDDGHSVKLMRAVANAGEKGAKFEDGKGMRIKSFMWEKIGNMVADSVQDAGTEESSNWVRNCGFAQAWENVKDRPREVHLDKAPDRTNKPFDRL